MTPQEHYDEATRLALLGAQGYKDADRIIALAQVHATLARAGFDRDGEHRHTHRVVLADHGRAGKEYATTEQGRPA